VAIAAGTGRAIIPIVIASDPISECIVKLSSAF
jgi:hypothetical protein